MQLTSWFLIFFFFRYPGLIHRMIDLAVKIDKNNKKYILRLHERIGKWAYYYKLKELQRSRGGHEIYGSHCERKIALEIYRDHLFIYEY